jgi:hypothetical protein
MTNGAGTWTAGICVVLALGAFACGSDSDDRETSSRRAPQGSAAEAELTAYLVTAGDVARTRPGSAERTLVRWWQAMQYSDFDEAYTLLAPAQQSEYTRRAFQRTARFATVGGFYSKPDVVEQRGHRSISTVLVNLLTFEKGKVAGVVPTVFRLARVDGSWRVADLRYLERKADEGRAADG